MAKRRRDLGEEERQLWGKVTETITPLEVVLKRGRRRKPIPEEGLSEPPHDDPPVSAPVINPPAPPRPDHRHELMTALEQPKPKKPALKPLVPIDARTRRKIQRGSMAVEARIDLHGMTQAEAFSALRSFLTHTQMAGGRIVIVITGKGRPGSSSLVFDPNERGILRRVVPQWLSLPDFRALVAGYEEAGPNHGGGGALYVRLRKPKGIALST
jgi:DNA-nicking Smr family endonuclease